MSVYQDKKGRWMMSLNHDGKRYHKSLSHLTTRQEALNYETIFKSDLLQNKVNIPKIKGEMLFPDLVKLYCNYAEVTKLSYSKEEWRIKTLLEYFGSMKLNEINSLSIELYRAKRKKHKKKNGELLSNASINREITILSRMLSLAVENNIIDYNPCRRVKKLREDNILDRYLQPDEEERFLSVCTDRYEYMKTVILSFLHLGLRKSELRNLTVECIDLKQNFAAILKTKTGKLRKVPINSKLRPYLKELCKKRKTGYLFVNPITNKPYHDFECFGRLCKQAEIEGRVTIHTLRHTFCSRLVECNVPLIDVSQLAGHSTITMTARYSHSTPERNVSAVEQLANKF